MQAPDLAPEPTSPRASVARLWLASAVCLALGMGLYWLRRSFIASFFVAGTPVQAQAAPQALPTPTATALRVVLLDGLGADAAASLPELSKLCARGREYEVDTGFPTVSLPVQHSLWTGLTQEQAQIEFITARLPTPPAGSLPASIPGSVAVAESHVDIIASFGFSRIFPRDEREVTDAWRDHGFFEAARQAVGSDAPLSFIHVLRIDEAGHAEGAASPRYRDAAQRADAWLPQWFDAAPHARWLILADHGHRAAGGHGGRGDRIPFVRACLVDPEGQPSKAAGPIHLVDLSRALFEWADREPPVAGLGRPLEAATRRYVAGEHLARVPPSRWVVTAILLLAGIALSVRRGAGPWPWWIGGAYFGFSLLLEPPSLSLPAVYPPMGRDILIYGALGWALLFAALARSKADALPTVYRQLGLPLAMMGAAFALCWGKPPLLLHISAHASVLTSWCAAACVGSGLWLAGRGLASYRAQSAEG